MTHQVFCQRLQKEAPGLDYAPLPGPLGTQIYETISKEAWAEWMAYQTMLINENQLKLNDPNAQSTLMAEMKKFLKLN